MRPGPQVPPPEENHTQPVINRDRETLQMMDIRDACRTLYELDKTVATVALLHPTDYEPIARENPAWPNGRMPVGYTAGYNHREAWLRPCSKVPPGEVFVGTQEQARMIEEGPMEMMHDGV